MAVDQVNVTIDVQDAGSKRDGYGVKLILELHTSFANRTKSYADIGEVALDFATTTKVYKAADATFKQEPSPSTIKIGRIDGTDTDLTDTLNKIVLEDNAWYELETIDKTKANILLASAWIEGTVKIYGVSSEDSDIRDSAVSIDVLSTLKGLGYKRTFFIGHHQSGVDSSAGSITDVSSEVVTVTDVSHGLRVNDNVTISLGTDAATNGNKLVASVPTADTFTYTATGAIDSVIADPIEYFARYKFFESGWSGVMLPKEVGSDTWANQVVIDQVAIPTTVYNSSEIATIEAKGGNVYIEANGVSRTRKGVMVNGSRYIDVTRSVDWLDANMEADIDDLLQSGPVPYTNEGGSKIRQVIASRLRIAINTNAINPLSDDEDFQIFIPRVQNIDPADKTNRIFSGITWKALVGDKVHGVEVTGTLSR